LPTRLDIFSGSALDSDATASSPGQLDVDVVGSLDGADDSIVGCSEVVAAVVVVIVVAGGFPVVVAPSLPQETTTPSKSDAAIRLNNVPPCRDILAQRLRLLTVGGTDGSDGEHRT